MLVAMVLMLGLLVMSLLVTAYQAHALFLKARGAIARETVAAITADFNRGLAAALAAYTRVCYNSTRFPEASLNFPGLNRCDSTLAERAAEDFLNTWTHAVRIAYAEYGVQIKWRRGVAEIGHLLPHQPYFIGMLNYSWYRNKAGSYAFARLRLNLTTVGFYNWESNSLIGLTISIEGFRIENRTEDTEQPGRGRGRDGSDRGEELFNLIRIRASVDNGTYYGLLLARGWMEVYAYDPYTGAWSRVGIRDVTYEGLGYYRIALEQGLKEGTRVRIVASDERGIIVVAEDVVEGKEPSP